MLCGWGVKTSMASLQVKLCVAISEHCRKCIWYLNALYKCPDLLYFFTSSVFDWCRQFCCRADCKRLEPCVISSSIRQRCFLTLTCKTYLLQSPSFRGESGGENGCVWCFCLVLTIFRVATNLEYSGNSVQHQGKIITNKIILVDQIFA